MSQEEEGPFLRKEVMSGLALVRISGALYHSGGLYAWGWGVSGSLGGNQPPVTRLLPVPGHGILRGRGPANAAEQVWGADPRRDGALLPGRDCHGHRLGAPAGLRAQVGVAGPLEG